MGKEKPFTSAKKRWMAMKLFKKKAKQQNKVKPEWPCSFGNSKWWEGCKALFKKDTGGCIDPDDPEFDAQKIYQHWIKSYMTKK